jgi:hypothetical protein
MMRAEIVVDRCKRIDCRKLHRHTLKLVTNVGHWTGADVQDGHLSLAQTSGHGCDPWFQGCFWIEASLEAVWPRPASFLHPLIPEYCLGLYASLPFE